MVPLVFNPKLGGSLYWTQRLVKLISLSKFSHHTVTRFLVSLRLAGITGHWT
ncbi:hypothetical protein VH1807_contig00026-0007 [Vibrio harveyi]|nr:hypothetical protein VH1807_contig00026-0007 [Vibrio harveyi]